MNDHRQKTTRAIGWVLGSNTVSQIISFIFGIVLARLLTPEDFGMIAMTLAIIGVAGLLSDFGMGAALVHLKNTHSSHYNSIFWLNSGIGLTLTVIIFLFSEMIANFYGIPDLEKITKTLSICFVINAMTLVPRQRLVKQIEFRALAITDFSSMAISAIVAILCAMHDYGYWSLVIQQIVRASVNLMLSTMFAKWLPRLEFSIEATRQLFSFSINVFFISLVQYAGSQADKLIVGKFLGAEATGLYDKAGALMMVPVKSTSHAVGSVLFPAFSQIQDDKVKIASIFTRAISAVSLITFPMMLGLLITADNLVSVILGPQWLEVIPILKILCFCGLAISVGTMSGSIYLSQGRTDLQLKVNLVTQAIRITAIACGVPWGVIGVTIGFSIGTFISIVVSWIVAGNIIQLSLFTIIKTLLPNLILATLMALSLYLLEATFPFIEAGMHPAGYLLTQTITGMLCYTLLLIIFKPPGFKDILEVLHLDFNIGKK